MINLKKYAGIPLILKKEGLFFSKKSKPEFQEKSYLENKDFFWEKKLDKNKKLYYIYRNACLSQDQVLFKKNSLRYDLTLIFPGSVGKEAMRTVGHFHKNGQNQKNPYPEIYEVIYGQAIFLLQNEKNKVYALFAKEQDKIIIPPGFGHITVNRSAKPLVVSNLYTSQPNTQDYSFFKKSGPAFYPLKKKIPSFQQNPKYKSAQIEIIKKITKNNFNAGLNKTLYKEFLKNPKKFIWLNYPDKFSYLFKKLLH